MGFSILILNYWSSEEDEEEDNHEITGLLTHRLTELHAQTDGWKPLGRDWISVTHCGTDRL